MITVELQPKTPISCLTFQKLCGHLEVSAPGPHVVPISRRLV
jgi:hypothetical protein